MVDTTLRQEVQNGKAILRDLIKNLSYLSNSEYSAKTKENAEHLSQVLKNMEDQLDRLPEDLDAMVDSIIGEVVHERARKIEEEPRGAGPVQPTLPGIFGAQQYILRKRLSSEARVNLEEGAVEKFKMCFRSLRIALAKKVEQGLDAAMA